MAFGPGALNHVIEEIRQYGIDCIGMSQRRHVAAFGHFGHFDQFASSICAAADIVIVPSPVQAVVCP